MNFKDFLKKYTTVSSRFIKEYYIFYEMCENIQYGIFIDDVIKYLEIKNAERFYENFKKKYIEDVDYIKKTIKNEKMIKGEKYTRYYINLDTFEKICMMSKAEKANQVRDYFIILRKFIQYYKNHISDMIINDALYNPNGYVYIILVNKGKNIFKFGRTKNMRARLKNYATGKDVHPDIRFIMAVHNKDAVENCVKSLVMAHQFKPKQEIYKVNIDVIKNAISDCASVGIKYNDDYLNKDIDAYIVFDDPANNRKSKHSKIQSKNKKSNTKKNSKNKKSNTKKSSKNKNTKKNN